MKITYVTSKHVSTKKLSGLFLTVGWKRNISRIDKILKKSSHIISVYSGAQLKALIDKIKDKKYVSIGLFAWEQNPGNMHFYEKIGFKKVKTGMELEKYMKPE